MGGVKKMKKTSLYDEHLNLGAKIINFGSWQMPVQYSGIIEEHKAVRNAAGLFDASHMGEVLISGKDALNLVQRLITNDASQMKAGKVIYSPMCYEDGGIVDDLLVYKLENDQYMMVVNASNTTKDLRWINKNAELFENVDVVDKSEYYALIALQGPLSLQIISSIMDEGMDKDISDLKYYSFVKTEVNGIDAIVSRTGYTGELGFEIYLEKGKAAPVWSMLLEAGNKKGLKPAGLGARDTLRLEKAMCLYGNDIDETTNPLEADLAWTVELSKEDFNGKKELEKVKEAGIDRKLVGFVMSERGIPRHGYEVKVEGKVVGEVTSGSYSPSLDRNIGLAYIDKKYTSIGRKIDISIRKRDVNAKIVEKPFI